MQVLFDFSTLYQSNTVFSTSQPSPCHLDSVKLKEWWQKLPLAEKLEISQISSHDVVADINDAINDAILIFQVNRKSQPKNLITSKRSLDDHKDLQMQEFRFNFVGKDVLPDNIAQLISAYHAIIYTPKKKDSKATSTSENAAIDQQSIFSVREEHLDALVNLLEAVITDFGQEQRQVFDIENYSKIYKTIADYSCSQISVFKGVKSSSVLKLLHKLISVSILFEHNLYRSFLHQANQPSRESIEAKLSAKDSDSDKEQNDITTSASSSNSGHHQAHVDEPKITIEAFPTENIHANYYTDFSTKENEDCYMSTYQGFEVGNLDIDFEFVDILLTDYADKEKNLASFMKDLMQEIETQMKNYEETNNEYLGSDIRIPYGYYGLRPSPKRSHWQGEKREASPDSKSSYDDTGYDSYSYDPRRYPRKQYKPRYTRREQVYYMPKAKSNNGE